MDFKSGWADICKFLGKEIPDVDFPHKNKNSAITNEVFYGKPISLVMKTTQRELRRNRVLMLFYILVAVVSWYFQKSDPGSYVWISKFFFYVFSVLSGYAFLGSLF